MHALPNEELKNAVASGRISEIRQALQAELNDNRLSDEHIINTINWAAEATPSLFEDHDLEKSLFRQDPTTWDEDYFLDQKVELNYNFTRERFEHLVAIRKHLRQQGHSNFIFDAPKAKAETETKRLTPGERAQPYISQQQRQCKSRESDSAVPLIATVITGAAVAIGIRGIIAGTIGATVAVGAGYLLFKKLMR